MIPPSPTNRRRFLARSVAGLASAASILPRSFANDPGPEPHRILTVTGPVTLPPHLAILPHEHLTTDFLGAEKRPTPRYDRDQAFVTIRPHLQALVRRGVGLLAECTPAHIGRDVLLLQRLSESTGLRIVTNTGYYGAADNKFLPRHAFSDSLERLAERWLNEARDGIEGTGIRPGFIKLGTGNGPLPDVHARLLRAAARVHHATGLPIAHHTGDGIAARDELRILREENIEPSALIWVHAQNDPGPIQIELARQGVWISLDGYNLATRNPDRYLNLLRSHRDAGTLHRLLLSHDDGWAVEGEAPKESGLRLFENGNPKPFASIFDRLLPDLKMAGFGEAELRQLTHRNPAEALAIRRRFVSTPPPVLP